MSTESNAVKSAGNWQGKHVYLMAVSCLVVGLGVGYLIRGSQSPVEKKPAETATAEAPPETSGGGTAGAAPTMEQMQHMGQKSAEPLLEKLKADPNNPDLLNQVGTIYRKTHQFKEAAGYYEKALELQPKNAAIRTDLASCLYYTGDVEGAIAQLDQSIKDDPKFAGALYNLGMIKWKGKKDSAGAVEAWQKLLKLTSDPKQQETVKHLISQVQSSEKG
jgi:cytochrome c-type biogenesis protein CcmH/NrfG